MRKLLLATAALCSVMVLPAIAEAASGFSTANVNMRSGPSTAYPAVTLIPVGAPLRINGCLADLPWCDVSFAGGRGWVAGQYVQAVYQQRRVYVGPQYYRPLGIPTITFDLDNYWDRNYRGRDFYRDRDRWSRGPDWQRNGGEPIYRRPPPPPVYDPEEDDQGNWQRRHRPNYDDNYQGDDNPPPRFRPRYGNDGGPRYGDPDRGNFDGDNNPPRRRPQQDQQDRAQQPQQQQQQRPPRDQPPQGQPPRQQPPAPQPQAPQPQPPQPQPPQPQPPQPPPQAEPPRQPPQPQAQQPGRNEPPRVIRRNDGQVIQCPDGSAACTEPHSSHN